MSIESSTKTEIPRLYMAIGEELKDAIMNGDYPLNSKLPSEHHMCDIFNASRTVIREAIIMLEVEGFVEKVKGSGIYVIENKQVNSTQIRDEYAPFELLEARQQIESTICALAAKNITKADAIAMREAIEQEIEDLEEDIYQGQGDYQFHMAIAKATKNPVLVATADNLWQLRKNNKMWEGLDNSISDKKYASDWINDHKLILAALIRRDEDKARQAMWDHMENVKNRLFLLSDSLDIENCFLPD